MPSAPNQSITQKDLSGFRLTERDFEIFKFLYDQKFCALDTLYFRFFDLRASVEDPIAENMPAARQRLGILKRAGFLKTEKVYSESKSVYLLAKKGFKALQERFPELTYGAPIQSVDFRNFEHDSRVNLIRVALERRGKALKWYPERRIRIAGFRSLGSVPILPDTVIPDAVFLSSKGERVALELEISVRKKSRFRQKVEALEAVMSGNTPLIHRVLFVVASAQVKRDLSDILRGKPNFHLEDYEHFMESLKPVRCVSEEEPYAGEE